MHNAETTLNALAETLLATLPAGTDRAALDAALKAAYDAGAAAATTRPTRTRIEKHGNWFLVSPNRWAPHGFERHEYEPEEIRGQLPRLRETDRVVHTADLDALIARHGLRPSEIDAGTAR